MKTLVIIYNEGSDTKVAVIAQDKDTLKLLKVADFDVIAQRISSAQSFSSISLDGISGDISIKEGSNDLDGPAVSNEGLLNAQLSGIKLTACEFVPVITEPAIHYHIYEGSRALSPSKLSQEIIDEIQKSKNITVRKENLGYTELAGGQLLIAFADGEISGLKLISSLAAYNGRQRSYKVAAIKSADISLAYYIGKKKKFFPDDFSLIVHIGKEYSKLIFMQGKKLKHIGAVLDVGTVNLHTYDVYFSKILLEMENGGIPRIDNVVLCGEDDSENLILSFYGTFPEANISRLDFEEFDATGIQDELRKKMSSFSVPIAAGIDYLDDLSREHAGINLLPDYIKEEQKFFQFGWHALLVLPVLFIVTLFFTKNIITNMKVIKENTHTTEVLTAMKDSSQVLVLQIQEYQSKIDNFGGTQAILDSAAAGTEVWSKMTSKVSTFVEMQKSMWVTTLSQEQGSQISITGYGLTRGILTDFTESRKSGLLKSVIYELLRDKNAYKFTLNFDLNDFSGKDE
ncbi:MAG: hypothetical protein WCJ01_00820 [Ignavibacteria bacterium]